MRLGSKTMKKGTREIPKRDRGNLGPHKEGLEVPLRVSQRMTDKSVRRSRMKYTTS